MRHDNGACPGPVERVQLSDDGECISCGAEYPGVFSLRPLPGVVPARGTSPADLVALNVFAVDQRALVTA